MNAKLIFGMMAIVISGSAFADSMICEMTITRASRSGLLPDVKTVRLNSATIQESLNSKISLCSKTAIETERIDLCVTAHENAIGVFNVHFSTNTDSDDLMDSVGGGLFAKAVSGKKLADLTGRGNLSASFFEKMTNAKLDFPKYQGGDSLGIDDAVEVAVKKGVIKEKEIVYLEIDNCQIKK